MASAATPAAGTTHTSERSYAAFTGSRVAKSTDCNGTAERGNRLQITANPDLLPVGDAALQTSRMVTRAREARKSFVALVTDFVMHGDPGEYAPESRFQFRPPSPLQRHDAAANRASSRSSHCT